MKAWRKRSEHRWIIRIEDMFHDIYPLTEPDRESVPKDYIQVDTGCEGLLWRFMVTPKPQSPSSA